MFKRVLMIVAVPVLLLGAAAACTDTADLEDRVDGIEQQQQALSDQVQSLTEATQRSSIVAALKVLGDAGLHDIDEAANERNEVDAGASGGVGAALIAVAAAEWPDELQGGADSVVAALQDLLEALESADPAVVGPPAAAAHDAGHDFDHDAAAHLSQSLGLGGHEEEEGHEEEPAEGEAPGTEEEHNE